MSMRFVHESTPQRVCFGSGEAAATLTREAERLGASAVMVIAAESSRELAEHITAGLPGRHTVVRVRAGSQEAQRGQPPSRPHAARRERPATTVATATPVRARTDAGHRPAGRHGRGGGRPGPRA